MPTLTFEQKAERDRLTFGILSDLAYYIKYGDSDIPEVEIHMWKTRAATHGMSPTAVSQTVEEVRQVLNLMSKLNKKRVA